MTKLGDIQSAIDTLSPEEFSSLTRWLIEIYWQRWDAQIEKDSLFGQLDCLVQESCQETAKD